MLNAIRILLEVLVFLLLPGDIDRLLLPFLLDPARRLLLDRKGLQLRVVLAQGKLKLHIKILAHVLKSHHRFLYQRVRIPKTLPVLGQLRLQNGALTLQSFPPFLDNHSVLDQLLSTPDNRVLNVRFPSTQR